MDSSLRWNDILGDWLAMKTRVWGVKKGEGLVPPDLRKVVSSSFRVFIMG
jgi:hypothetical protein